MARVAKPAFLAVVLLFLTGATAQAATINAASCSFADVTSAVNAAVNGDTVVLPSCPGGVSYTSTLTISKGITLQGQGIGVTVLVDDAPKGASNCGGSNPMLGFLVNSPNAFRLSSLTIRGSAPDSFKCQPGHLRLAGTSKAFRIDHVKFENQQTAGIRTFGDLWGVIDHCEFEGTNKQGVIVEHPNWGGQTDGDGSWADPTNLGSQEFIFIEDCIFTDTRPVGAGVIDMERGGRVVFRHNTAGFWSGHGTESSGRRRGMRAFEVYENIFTAPGPATFTAILLRGGTGVIHDNVFVGDYTSIILASNFRDRDRFNPWGTCDGTSPYDVNDGIVYASGSHDGPDGVSNTLTDTTQNFTTACGGAGCGAGEFSIRNTTKGWGSIIARVTATTVTNQSSTFGQGRVWNIGDSYEIRKAYPCIDQVGRGQGDLLTGSTPTPVGWPNQALEPVYQWNNTKNGVGSPTMSSNSVHIRVNRDFFNNVVKPGYTPFQYPHPLTLTSGGPPATPLNLRKIAP